MRNVPLPRYFEASTMPLDSQEPAAPFVVEASLSVGPSSADWSTLATTNGAPPALRS